MLQLSTVFFGSPAAACQLSCFLFLLYLASGAFSGGFYCFRVLEDVFRKFGASGRWSLAVALSSILVLHG